MRIVEARGGRPVDEFGSAGARFAPVTCTVGWSRVGVLPLRGGGRLGSHPAPTPQLFLVVEGDGVVADGAGNRIEVWPGEA